MAETSNSMTKMELEKQLNQVANNVDMFVNFSKEAFTCSWDNAQETFQAGQVTYLPHFKFLRYQKHLVDREMNRANIPTNNHLRKDFEVKCTVPVVEEDVNAVEAAAKAEAKKLEKQTDPAKEIAEAQGQTATPKKKPGRPKKVMDEDSFEGLKS